MQEGEKTLLECLSDLYPDSSKRTLLQWIHHKRVSVEGTIIANEKEKISLQAKVVLHAKEARAFYRGIKYLYVDRYMIAIEKPCNLLSVPSLDPEEKNALELIQEDFQTNAISAVHRLDREASGVLLFARGKESQERLKALFERHTLRRVYLAIVEGVVENEQGVWRSYLLEKPNYEVVTVSKEEGREAITHYKVLRTSKKFSYLELLLETGRKHQIRVHCQEAGHPVVGDKRYGAMTNPMKRLALHAHRLEFIHPFTQKKVHLLSPQPKAFMVLGGTHLLPSP